MQVSFVFHGGSGSDIKDIKKAITYGVIKMNIDTDTQVRHSPSVITTLLSWSTSCHTGLAPQSSRPHTQTAHPVYSEHRHGHAGS